MEICCYFKNYIPMSSLRRSYYKNTICNKYVFLKKYTVSIKAFIDLLVERAIAEIHKTIQKCSQKEIIPEMPTNSDKMA